MNEHLRRFARSASLAASLIVRGASRHRHPPISLGMLRAARFASLAVTCVATDALAAGVAPGQATPVQREQAQSRFLRGKTKFASHDYAAALTEFNASLDIVASPNTRLFVGRSLREMGRLVEAYVELGRTEIEAKELSKDDPRYDKAGQSAHEERAKLEPQLGFVEVQITHAEPTTTLKVGADDVRPGGWSEPIPVMPGDAQIVVATQGRAPVVRTVTVQPGEHKGVTLDAAEGAPAPEGSGAAIASSDSSGSPNTALRSAAYVAGGAAIVGLGLFTVFGIMANGTYSDLEKACPGGPCPDGHAADISEGKTQQTVANIGLAVFAVGAAAGVTLFFVSRPSSKTSASGPTARATVGPSFVGVSGAF